MIDVTYVISERGERLPAAADAIEHALGTKRAPAQLMKYLIGSMGFIGISLGKRVVDIVYDDAAVSPVALAGLSYFIADHARRPYAFREMLDDQKVDLFPNGRAALRHVGELIDRRQSLPRLWRAAVPIENTSFAVRADAALEIATTDLDNTLRLHLLDKLFGGVFSISRWDPDTRHFRVDHISATVARLDQNFVANSKGRTFHSFIDDEYGQWVADAFAEMVDRDGPQTESIAARVKIRDTHVNANYTRFLLPFRRGGSRYVLASNDFAKV